MYEKTDLHLPGPLPIDLTRVYRQNDSEMRPFGRGATHPYAMFLWTDDTSNSKVNLILPHGQRGLFERISGTANVDAVLESTPSALNMM